ncbi:MAG: hypothetical protein ABSG25_08760 [Bryobacteraceae bacterium]
MCRAQRRTQSFPNFAALAQTEDGESVSEAARSVYRLLSAVPRLINFQKASGTDAAYAQTKKEYLS